MVTFIKVPVSRSRVSQIFTKTNRADLFPVQQKGPFGLSRNVSIIQGDCLIMLYLTVTESFYTLSLKLCQGIQTVF